MFPETIQYTLTQRLNDFTNEFFISRNRVEVITKFREEIEKITPIEAIRIFNTLALRNESFNIIKINIDKFTSILYKPLKSKNTLKNLQAFYFNLHTGNAKLLKSIEQSRPLVKKLLHQNKRNNSDFATELVNILELIKKHNITFRKEKETLLNLLEKVLPAYMHYFKIERLFQNDLNYMLIQGEQLLGKIPVDRISLNILIGKLYFRLHLSLYREELVLFPLGKQFIHERIIQT